MLNIDKMSRVPIYEQIESGVKELILAGLLQQGDKLPSVRALSLQLNINPNTIQKAYLDLDRLGLISSVAGRGSFVSEEARAILMKEERGRLTELENMLCDLLAAGVSKDELQQVLDRAVSQNSNKIRKDENI